VSGQLRVRPEDRDSYLETCREVVNLGRTAEGCLHFALSPDLVDPARINILERWESQAAVEAFRGDGVGDDQGSMIVTAEVAEYADVRPLT
jgi:quinol monooxygenase YgiN